MDCGYLYLPPWIGGFGLCLRDSLPSCHPILVLGAGLVWVVCSWQAGVAGFEGRTQAVDTVCLLRVVVVWCWFQLEVVEGAGQGGDGNKNGAWEGCARSR